MSYYKGDFYQGDFYSGDPGFFSMLGKIGGRLGGLIPGVGPIVSKGISAITKVTSKPGVGTMVREAAGRAGTIVAKHPVLTAAGAAGTIGLLGAGAGRMTGRMGMVPAGTKGFHVSKKTGKLVRNRHMRVTNPRALRRALRRAHGFAKLAMRTIHLVHPKKKARFGGFKKRVSRAR